MSIQKKNLEVAESLTLLGDLVQLEKNGQWKSKAYYKAARVIRDLDVPIDSVADYQKLSGVGASIAKKIKYFLIHGTCPELEYLRKEYPGVEEALTMTTVPGVGIKKALGFYNNGIKNFDELVKASDAGKISNKQIVKGIKLALRSRGRLPINQVLPVVKPVLKQLQLMDCVVRAEFAGSVRRGRETVRDVDILIVTDDHKSTTDTFLMFGEELISGEHKARIMVQVDRKTSVQVDLLFTTKESWGASLAYFTGSKEHNIAIRKLANSKGMTFNEHGFYNMQTGERLGGSEEHELYDLLGIPFCPPELREGDEIKDEIPKLVTREDIDSDWHMHTTWSRDARDSFDDMTYAARNRGLKTIGVTDHTEVQYGWDPNRIGLRKAESVVSMEKFGVTVYAGCETGVNKDGTLDWPDQHLEKMDYVIASIHRSHSYEPVKRLIAAARHPKVKIIGHPTGRMIGRRDIPDENWDELFEVCAEEGVLLEINGGRLDLPVKLIKRAKELGCKFVITSDAHSIDQMVWQDYALGLARRAGLTNDDLATPF